MTRQVTLNEAKAKLAQLVEDAARGEEIVIAKHGKPLVKLVPAVPANAAVPLAAKGKRKLGQLAHLVDPNDKRTDDDWWRDWKALDAEIERDFEQSISEDWDREGWPDTSSTLTSSSGLNEDPHRFVAKLSPKSKKRKTRSS